MATTLDSIPHNRSAALTYLGSYDEPNERPCGNNTRVFSYHDSDDGRLSVVLRLHNTNIVKLTPDGRIILNSGGWQTVTTKDRINRVIRYHGYNLYQKDYVWYIRDRINNRDFKFHDGIVLANRN